MDCVLVLSEPGGGGGRSRQFTDDLSSANAAKACNFFKKLKLSELLVLYRSAFRCCAYKSMKNCNKN